MEPIKPDAGTPKIVDRAAFQADVDALRVKEKAHTRQGERGGVGTAHRPAGCHPVALGDQIFDGEPEIREGAVHADRELLDGVQAADRFGQARAHHYQAGITDLIPDGGVVSAIAVALEVTADDDLIVFG